MDRCDCCGREATRWNMLRVTPDDEELDEFECCIFCLRSWNTMNLLTETVATLRGSVTWMEEGKTNSMPSAAPYHPSPTV